jgi:hypothetical protein
MMRSRREALSVKREAFPSPPPSPLRGEDTGEGRTEFRGVAASFFTLLLSTLHASLFTPSQALACSSCIGWVKDRPLWDNGFVLSTMLIMAMPFAVFGTIGGWIFYTYRHSKRENASHFTLHTSHSQKEDQ